MFPALSCKPGCKLHLTEASVSEMQGVTRDSTAGSDDDEDEDLTDAQMFGMDAALSAALRAATEGKSPASRKSMREALVDFKFRVLDLLESYAKHCPNSALLPGTIPPLLRSLRTLGAPGGHEQLANTLLKVIEAKISRSAQQLSLSIAAIRRKSVWPEGLSLSAQCRHTISSCIGALLCTICSNRCCTCVRHCQHVCSGPRNIDICSEALDYHFPSRKCGGKLPGRRSQQVLECRAKATKRTGPGQAPPAEELAELLDATWRFAAKARDARVAAASTAAFSYLLRVALSAPADTGMR